MCHTHWLAHAGRRRSSLVTWARPSHRTITETPLNHQHQARECRAIVNQETALYHTIPTAHTTLITPTTQNRAYTKTFIPFLRKLLATMHPSSFWHRASKTGVLPCASPTQLHPGGSLSVEHEDVSRAPCTLQHPHHSHIGHHHTRTSEQRRLRLLVGMTPAGASRRAGGCRLPATRAPPLVCTSLTPTASHAAQAPLTGQKVATAHAFKRTQRSHIHPRGPQNPCGLPRATQQVPPPPQCHRSTTPDQQHPLMPTARPVACMHTYMPGGAIGHAPDMWRTASTSTTTAVRLPWVRPPGCLVKRQAVE